jgi:hypothetical protein
MACRVTEYLALLPLSLCRVLVMHQAMLLDGFGLDAKAPATRWGT